MNDNTGNSGVASIYNQVSIQAVSLIKPQIVMLLQQMRQPYI